MTPSVKRCCIRALEKPNKKVARVMDHARQCVWSWDGDKTLTFKPERLKAFVTEQMEALRRSGVVSEWQFELREDNWGQNIAKIEFVYHTKVYYPGVRGFDMAKSAGTLSVRL
jgi:hypothetical protein